MGARHQLFIVAKVRNRLRTLAAIHHQSLSHERPLQRCLRVLEVVKAAENRVPILHEIRAAREYDNDLWCRCDIFQPFPFIATCLLLGCSFDPNAAYQDRVHPERFNLSLSEVDNDEGITVIDVSNPEEPKYCFAFLPGQFGVEFSDLLSDPLSPSKYLSRYIRPRGHVSRTASDVDDLDDLDDRSMNSDDTKDDDYERNSFDSTAQIEYDRLCDQLSPYKLISKELLESVWSERAIDRDSASPRGQDISPNRTSLRDTAMDMFTKMIAEGIVDTSSLAEAQQLPDFKHRLISKLRTMALNGELPSTAATASCLEFAFSKANSVDLSALSSLSASCVVEAVTKIMEHGEVKTLDLSHMRQLSETDMTDILNAANGVETLYLLEMPQITLQFIYSLCNKSDSYPPEIYHTELLARPFADGRRYTYSQLMADLESPPFATGQSSPIKQIIFARVMERRNESTIDWSHFSPATDMLEWHSGDKMSQFVLPLRDLFVHPMKLVYGLVNIMALLEESDPWDEEEAYSTGFTMAKSFAMTPVRTHGPCVKVGVMPAMLFKTARMAANLVSVYWPILKPTFMEGEWSIVLINEHQSPSGAFERKSDARDGFRLAVITPKTKGKGDGFSVVSIEEFLQDVMGKESGAAADDVAAATRYWTSTAANIGKCEAEEVHQLLPVLERNYTQMMAGNAGKVHR
ncbi:MAG: hypothetical protein LQ352_005404, partial [Teloschistes flavicans]